VLKNKLVKNKNAGKFYQLERDRLWKYAMPKKRKIRQFKNFYMPILMYGHGPRQIPAD
jgi:hypothetical protein